MFRLHKYKFIKLCLVFLMNLLCISFVNIAYAQTLLSVPFDGFIMNPSQILQASYTIGNHRMIFCYSANTQTVGFISWPFQGTRPFSTLPVLLKTEGQFDGQFADNSGVIFIQNTTNVQLVVGCLFGF